MKIGQLRVKFNDSNYFKCKRFSENVLQNSGSHYLTQHTFTLGDDYSKWSKRGLIKLGNRSGNSQANLFEHAKHNLVPLVREDLIESNDLEDNAELEQSYNAMTMNSSFSMFELIKDL